MAMEILMPAPGKLVPMPEKAFARLPADGAAVDTATAYWLRRLHQGDVLRKPAPRAAAPALKKDEG